MERGGRGGGGLGGGGGYLHVKVAVLQEHQQGRNRPLQPDGLAVLVKEAQILKATGCRLLEGLVSVAQKLNKGADGADLR